MSKKTNDTAHSATVPWLLYLTVVMSGGAVMILELLGTRIVAPFYGVSLYVWSALIAVTMMALASGYYLGGYVVTRFPNIRLAHIIMLAAVTTALVPFLSGPVLQMTNPLGLRLGALLSAVLLFAVPLTALAMVGPLVIQAATETVRNVGKVVGSVYAISTLGSVLATLILALWLLPWFGTRAIIFVVSALLLGLAFVLSWQDNKRKNNIPTISLMVSLAVVSALTATSFSKPAYAAKDFKVAYQQEGGYGWVRVVDDQRAAVRLLLSDSSVLSATAMDNGRSLLDYQNLLGLLPIVRPKASDALLIGLGGGHVATDLKAKGLATDTIEIDPLVADAALNYFNFKPTGEFIVGDARYEVKQLSKHYDFIIHDCFTGGSEPTHMLTVEMLRQLRDLLKSDGVLALNYVGYTRGEGKEAVASVYKTLKQVFPQINVLVTEKKELTDFIFLASQQSVALDANSADQRVHWLIDHQYPLSDEGGVVVTDDYNPLEHMQVRKAENYRQLFMERVSPELLLL